MESQAVLKPAAFHAPLTHCRLCTATAFRTVIDLGNQYLPRWVDRHDDTLPKAPLRLVQCAACGLLQLGEVMNKDALFRDYWYRSSMNQTMREALEDVVRDARQYAKHGTWLDIGANDGWLLERVSSNFTKLACEPANAFHQDLSRKVDVLIPSYFQGSPEPCDVITSCAMFYDVDDPARFVRQIADSLKTDGVWINQLNDSPTMLERNAFDSICHEHAAYYDLHQLDRLYRENGMVITRVTRNEVNGGSVRVFARKGSWMEAEMMGFQKATNLAVDGFARRVGKWRDRMQEWIDLTILHRGPLWGYGASTKGATLLQYLNRNEAFVAIADKNPLKHGKLMAGCWVPIADELAMRAAKPSYLVMLPWAFRNEFVEREAEVRAAGTTLVFPLPNPEFVL